MIECWDYLLSPLAPLVFRLGTPFGATEAATTADFPSPSTLAGAVRTAASRSSDASSTPLPPVWGPLLLEMSAADGHSDILLPTPADLVFARDPLQGMLKAFALAPRRPSAEAGWDSGLASSLLPVDFVGKRPQEKLSGAPAFLRFIHYIHWLCGILDLAHWSPLFGSPSVPRATREHIRIDPSRQIADEGILFRSQGLDYGPRRIGETVASVGHYGLIVRAALAAPNGSIRVGGRARLAHLAAAPGVWPDCPRKLREQLRRRRGIRLILATPALFDRGWLPGWLTPHEGGWSGQPDPALDLTLILRAAAVAEWQPASMRAAAGTRSPAQRLVPAGSVYWFEVLGDSALAADLWLRPLSDREQDRNDGFGLVLPGVWEPPSTAKTFEE